MHGKKAKHKFFINQLLTSAICLIAQLREMEEEDAFETINLCITQDLPYKAVRFYAMENC
jgi:hypothetical protein